MCGDFTWRGVLLWRIRGRVFIKELVPLFLNGMAQKRNIFEITKKVILFSVKYAQRIEIIA